MNFQTHCNRKRKRKHIPHLEFRNEKVEMLEARIQMSFLAKRYNFLKMRIIHVRVDSKKSLENLLHHALKMFGKLNVYTRWKELIVI